MSADMIDDTTSDVHVGSPWDSHREVITGVFSNTSQSAKDNNFLAVARYTCYTRSTSWSDRQTEVYNLN